LRHVATENSGLPAVSAQDTDFEDADTMGDLLAAIVGCALEILVLLSGCRRDVANKSKQCS
jgi:hypothetical protein